MMAKQHPKPSNRWKLRRWLAFALSVLLMIAIQVAIAPGASSNGGEPSAESSTDSPNGASTPAINDVMLDNQILFTIDASAGRLNREARAKEISENIRSFAANSSISLESLTIRDRPNNDTTQILAGDTVLFAVTEDDAKAADKNRNRLAQQYYEVIKDAVAQYREVYSPQQMLIAAGKAAIATAVFLLLLWLLNRIYRLLRNQTRTRYNLLPTIQIGRRELFNPQQLRILLVRTANVIRFLAILTLISIYLNTVLSFFPQTRSISVGIFTSIFSVFGQLLAGIIGYIPKLIFLIILGYVTFYLLRFVRFVFGEVQEGAFSIPGFEQEWAIPTARIAQLLIVAFFGIIAFPYLPGAGSDAFQGISIFLGILISLGSSTAISNVVAGILLTYTRAFRIGDRVKIAEVYGTVVEKGLLVIRIFTDTNQYVSIPNATVLSSNVTNFRVKNEKDSDTPPPIITLEVGMDYQVPWQKAYDILLEATRDNSYILPEPQPYVLHHALNSSQVIYQLNAYTNAASQEDSIRSDLRRAIQERCNQGGIELMLTQAIALREKY